MIGGAGRWRALMLCAACVALPDAGRSFEPELPVGARQTVARDSQLDSFDAPTGRFANGVLPAIAVEGAITRQAWRIGTAGLTPLQVIVPLREQIEAAGYEVVFECAAASCGGFDFRFATEVLPGPNMYVNLARFRYLTALDGPRDAPRRAIGVLVSVTSSSAYAQIITADTGRAADVLVPEVAPPDPLPEPVQTGGAQLHEMTSEGLLARGFTVLGDLIFETGSTDLGPGSYASLQQLAEILTERPDLRIALVGHTDTVGGLEPNIAVSRARARSVRQRLISEYGIAAARLDAEGMGYLAPVASNLTEEGRRANRRVEAVVLEAEQR